LYKELSENVLELIFIDDDSTDYTEKVLNDHYSSFAKIVNIKDKHPDYLGKNFACLKGYENAKGEYFLFLDADVKIKNFSFLLDVEYEKNIVTTFLPFFYNKNLFEYFSLFFYQILYFNFFVLNSDEEVFGGCYLVSRDTYESIGTHEAIKDKIVEDIEIARLFKNVGNKIEIKHNKHVIIRMYDSFDDLKEGWTKNISLGSKRIKKRNVFILGTYVFFVAATVVPSFLLPYIMYTYPVITLCLYLTSGLYLSKSKKYLFMWPIFVVAFIIIYLYSLTNVTKTWKGRDL